MGYVTVVDPYELAELIQKAKREVFETERLLKLEQHKLENEARTFWHRKNPNPMMSAANEFAKTEQQLYTARAYMLLLHGMSHSNAAQIAETAMNTNNKLEGLRVITHNKQRTAFAFQKPEEESAWLLVGYKLNKTGMVIYEPEFITDTNLGKASNE